MKLHFGICQNCGKEYSKPRPLRSKFCSKTCHNTFLVRGHCGICGSDFRFGLCRRRTFTINGREMAGSTVCHDCIARLYRVNRYQANKDEQNEYYKNRKRTNPEFRIRSNLSTRFFKVLKRTSKSTSTVNLIGCLLEELKRHLESQFYAHPETGEMMTWDNYGQYGWHIDHIVPCASFDLTDPEQQRKCFNWTNLQPLWAIHNLHKSDKLDWCIS